MDLAGSHGLIKVEWKVGICEFLLLVSLLFFVQTIRLLMYMVRRCNAWQCCSCMRWPTGYVPFRCVFAHRLLSISVVP